MLEAIPRPIHRIPSELGAERFRSVEVFQPRSLAKKQRRILDSCIIAGHTQFYMFFLILLGDDFWKMFVFSIIGSTVNARSCHSLQLFTEYHTFPT